MLAHLSTICTWLSQASLLSGALPLGLRAETVAADATDDQEECFDNLSGQN